MNIIDCLNKYEYSSIVRVQIPRPYFHIMWLSVQSFTMVIIWCTAVLFAMAIRGECEVDDLENSKRLCIGRFAIRQRKY